MKLYIGGRFQGQLDLARAENPGSEIVAGFNSLVPLDGDPAAFAQSFCLAHPNAVVVAEEVGCGVVPMLAPDRRFRENVGRALCIVARESEAVVRVCCGIGVRIK